MQVSYYSAIDSFEEPLTEKLQLSEIKQHTPIKQDYLLDNQSNLRNLRIELLFLGLKLGYVTVK